MAHGTVIDRPEDLPICFEDATEYAYGVVNPLFAYAKKPVEDQVRTLEAALARAQGQLRQKEETIREYEHLSALLTWQKQATQLVGHLTPRQNEVMMLVLGGISSKNIAYRLHISQRTVENHRAAIMKKTGSKCLPALGRMGFAVTHNGIFA